MWAASRWLALLLLAGCATPQRLDPATGAARLAGGERPAAELRSGPVRLSVGADAGGERADDGADAALHTDLIRNMIEQGKYYAAVAHIEAQRRQTGDTAQLRWLEGDARRRLQQYPEAARLLQTLARTPYAARAEHGLGLIAAARRQPAEAVRHFERAVALAPTVAEFRNDLGVSYLRAGQYESALVELATATELAPGDPRSRNNLIVLLLASGDGRRAREVADALGLGPDAFARLQAEAQTLAGRRSTSPPSRSTSP
jgi:Flp pilus assembly protein TadD